jgi:polyisoprenoid-binding protein YceI
MTTALQQDLPAATWGLDKNHSTATFAIKYMVSTFRTGFESFDVTLDTTGDQPRLSGSVDPASISVKDEHFHAHLQSPDFFDTERHPAITFESTSWRVDGDELVVDGDLTIKGVTRPARSRRAARSSPRARTRGATRASASRSRRSSTARTSA